MRIQPRILAVCLLAAATAASAAPQCLTDRLLPHEADCAKFYQCVHGARVEMRCPAGTWFDRDLQICNWPQLVNCELLTENIETTTKGHVTPTEDITSEAVDVYVCPESPHVHKLLPHEENCARFYQCVHGSKVAMECAPGTWFDYDLQVCNWPDLVTCRARPTTEATKTPTEATITEQYSAEQVDSSSAEAEKPESSSEAKENESGDGYDASSEANTSESVNGTDVDSDEQATTKDVTTTTTTQATTTTVKAESNEENVQSNEELPQSSEEITDTQPEVDTSAATPEPLETEEELTTTANVESSEEIKQSSEETQSESTEELPGGLHPQPEVGVSSEAVEPVESEEGRPEEAPICPPGVSGNVRHPTLCDSYYMCSSGFPILLRCSSGFEFDPELRRCVVITGKGCTFIEESSEEQQFKSSEEIAQSHEERQESSENNVPAGLNPRPEIDTSAEASVAICPAGFSGNVPDLESCFSYYLCSSGIPIKLHCSAGFEYNTLSMRCEAISATGCSAGVEAETVTQSSQALCPDNWVGNVASADSCAAYFYCAMSVPVPLRCSSGFEFDPDVARCVPISDSGCTAQRN